MEGRVVTTISYIYLHGIIDIKIAITCCKVESNHICFSRSNCINNDLWLDGTVCNQLVDLMHLECGFFLCIWDLYLQIEVPRPTDIYVVYFDVVALSADENNFALGSWIVVYVETVHILPTVTIDQRV